MKMSAATRALAAFIVGQVVQLILHIFARSWYMSNPVLFCLCSGFLVTAAVIAGIVLEQSAVKPEHAKTYKDYAEAQEEMRKEVERIFGTDGK